MTKCKSAAGRGYNTLRNYRIASLYGRIDATGVAMSYSKIARIIGCSRSCVAGVIRWHVKQMARLPEDDTRMPQAPSVAYVRGLEAYGNTRYRMSTERGQADAS